MRLIPSLLQELDVRSMDLNSLSFLGPAGYTLSIEEKASLEVNFIQRSREVSPRGADVHRARWDLVPE